MGSIWHSVWCIESYTEFPYSYHSHHCLCPCNSEQRRLLWEVPSGPGQWPVAQCVPCLGFSTPQCHHLFCVFPNLTPHGSQKEEELEPGLLGKAVHFAVWKLALGRDVASVWFGDYLRVAAPAPGAPLLLQPASEAAKGPSASSQCHFFKAGDRNHFPSLCLPGLVSISGVF